MSAWKKRLNPIAYALLLLMSPVWASSNETQANSAAVSPYQGEMERMSEREQRMAIVKRANEMFTLLGAEIALQQGDAGSALVTYMVLLERTRDPEVAERAMEMAISLGAFEQAESIYRRWREIEPTAGPALKRITWARNMIRGDFANAVSGFDEVIHHANDVQKRRIFLLVAQTSVQQPELAKLMAGQVHQRAKQYRDMPEAMIADAILSALNNDNTDAVHALQRLAELDSEILPPTQLTLRLIGQRKPEVLNQFFAETQTAELSPMWRELQVESLIHAGKNQDAYNLLQQLLAKQPDADLYIQAALLAVNQKKPLDEVLAYLAKAAQYGTQEQQSRAAVIATMRSADAAQYAQAREWLAKIQDPEYRFDKAVLQASLDAQDGQWQNALAATKRARSFTKQQGRFFGDAELLRVELFIISKQNNPQQAIQELTRLLNKVSKQPDSNDKISDILYQRGLIYADRLQQPEKAIADLQRYVQLNPGSADGMNALGYTMLSAPKADIDTAFRLIQAAFQQDPESAAINDSMGWAYFRKGDIQAALPYLEYAFREQPDPEVASHLGEVLWKLGRQEEAKTVFQQGLQQKEGNLKLLRDTLRRLGITINPTPPKTAP